MKFNPGILFRFSIRSMLVLITMVAIFITGYRIGHQNGLKDRPSSFDDLVTLIQQTIKKGNSNLSTEDTISEFSSTISCTISDVFGPNVSFADILGPELDSEPIDSIQEKSDLPQNPFE